MDKEYSIYAPDHTLVLIEAIDTETQQPVVVDKFSSIEIAYKALMSIDPNNELQFTIREIIKA